MSVYKGENLIAGKEIAATTPTIQADANLIVIGDGNDWAEENEISAVAEPLYNKPIPGGGWGNPIGSFIGTYVYNSDMEHDSYPTVFGRARHLSSDTHSTVWNGLKVSGSAKIVLGDKHYSSLDGASSLTLTDKAKIDVNGTSEVRVYGGAKMVITDEDFTVPIYGQPSVTYEAGVTFTDGTDSVHFTIAELQALKNMIE